MPSSRLFVSHSHLDSPFAKRLVADLQGRLGTDAVWMDESGGLHGGDEWWNKIVQEITDRDTFLVVLSPKALDSAWVQKEMGIAYFQYVKAGKKLRPILLEPCSLATHWELIQAINFSGEAALPESSTYTAKLEELLGTLTVVEEQKHKPEPLSPAKKQHPPAILRLVRDIQVAFGKQDWYVVEEKSETLAELAPEAFTAALWQERGLALLALGAPDQALSALEQALSADPHDIPTLQAKGMALLAIQQMEQAIKTLQRAYNLAPLEDDPLRLRVLADLIEALRQAGRWDEATRRAEYGVKLAPGDAAWQQRLLSALLAPLETRFDTAIQAQRWQEALATCSEALHLAPKMQAGRFAATPGRRGCFTATLDRWQLSSGQHPQ